MSEVPSSYEPSGPPGPVVAPQEFCFAATHLDHPHIFSQCKALVRAGATLSWVHDRDPAKAEKLATLYPGARVAREVDQIFSDDAVRLVAAAAVPDERGAWGCQVLRAGKDYFTDKTPFVRTEQLEEARRTVMATGRKFFVYYAERLHNEAAMHATDLIRAGAIGRVLQMVGLGPHRLNAPARPPWFFERARYGGILCDIGSHHFEQFLAWSGASDAEVAHAAVANHTQPEFPELEDYGEAALVGDNGVTAHVRVDWLTPNGLKTWGDGRSFVLGSRGYLELRKHTDLGRPGPGNHVFLVDDRGEYHLAVDGRVGHRFFGEMILDCLHRTERAMTQRHIFKAAELALRAQAQAVRLASRGGRAP